MALEANAVVFPPPYPPYQSLNASTAITAQPAAYRHMQLQPVPATHLHMTQGEKWSSGLFGCFDDMEVFCCLCFSPFTCFPCLMARMAKEHLFMPCIVPTSMSFVRQKVRMSYGIPGSILDDCLLTSCMVTAPCAHMQTARELKIRSNERFC